MIGTIGDVMPLTGEKPRTVINGLKMVKALSPSPLKDLIDERRKAPYEWRYRISRRSTDQRRRTHEASSLLALEALLEGGEEALTTLHQLNGD